MTMSRPCGTTGNRTDRIRSHKSSCHKTAAFYCYPKGSLVQRELSAARLTERLCAGTCVLKQFFKSIVLFCSAGPISFARPKEIGERKRHIGEGLKRRRPALYIPPPEIETHGTLKICLHNACWLLNCQLTKNFLPCNGLGKWVCTLSVGWGVAPTDENALL